MPGSKRQLASLREQRAEEWRQEGRRWKAMLLVWGYGAGLLGMGVWLVVSWRDSWEILAGVAAVLAALVAAGMEKDRRRKARLAESRAGESICGFARSFPRGSVAPVLLRAVYESTQEMMGPKKVPIRAGDRWEEDLGLDGEDVDDVFFEVAELLGISFEEAEEHPVEGKMETVGDLVRFLNGKGCRAIGGT